MPESENINQTEPLVPKGAIDIHKLTITQARESTMFQLKIPQKAIAVTGILVNVVAIQTNEVSKTKTLIEKEKKYNWSNTKFGQISFRLNNEIDILHTEDVFIRESTPVCEKLIDINSIQFGVYQFSMYGYPTVPVDVAIDRKESVIHGFYKDEAPEGYTYPYQLLIYLFYELP